MQRRGRAPPPRGRRRASPRPRPPWPRTPCCRRVRRHGARSASRRRPAARPRCGCGPTCAGDGGRRGDQVDPDAVSDEPPPMSNRRAPRRCCGSISEAQPATASRASVSRDDDLERRARSPSARGSMKSGPFSAVRQASVAISRMRRTPRSLSFAWQILRRLDGAIHRRLAEAAAAADALAEPDDAREASTTWNAAIAWPRDQQPAIVGAEIERGIKPVGILRSRKAGRHLRRPCKHRLGDDRRQRGQPPAAAPAHGPEPGTVASAPRPRHKPAGASCGAAPSSCPTDADRKAVLHHRRARLGRGLAPDH